MIAKDATRENDEIHEKSQLYLLSIPKLHKKLNLMNKFSVLGAKSF